MPLATVGCSTPDDRKCLNACEPLDSPNVKEDDNKNNNNTRRIRRNNVPRSKPRERAYNVHARASALVHAH